jgi:hypothetical protein
MRRTDVAIILALAVMPGGCSPGNDETTPGRKPQSTSTSSTATGDPASDTVALLRDLAMDALAIDPRAQIMDRNAGTTAFFDTLFTAHSDIARPGSVSMPATFTILYPGFDPRTDSRAVLRLLRKHGFGTKYAYEWEDLEGGRVQRSGDLRCQVWLENDAARLACVSFEFLDHVEYGVADELTSLYADETDDMDIGCWELLYPNAEHSEPPYGAILETGKCDRRSWVRAYVDDGDGWKLVARSRGGERIGPEVAAALCRPEYRDAYLRMSVCPSSST